MESDPTSESSGRDADNVSGALGEIYFPRRLTLAADSILENQVDEAGLLALAGNKIVLGEPGMGKSVLMRELGRRLGVKPVTAIRFINAKNPGRLVPSGKPLLIDGLDEAVSRREGDAVDKVLAQLEEAGAPPFILSCRSREWQSRTVTNVRQLYGADPNILTLEPFNDPEARAYLLAQHPSVDADHVLHHLAAHNLNELYCNPLTLELVGLVAASDTQLPATRGALFESVCTLVWPEHDADRQDEGLAQLTPDEALDAAGAICAGLLLAGFEAASMAGAAQVQQGDLRLAELKDLPNATQAPVVFSSKLFQSVGPLRAKPLHRVIAEFLGARWLARQAKTPRLQRRLLAQLHRSGGVPASLRGLHAWLAYHSIAMAERVVAADPYGVLRYGETAAFTPHLANCLFEALCALAEDNPYFRSADWDSKTAAGLMIPTLKEDINNLIKSSNSNHHLRSLLIEGLIGSPLAAELSGTLEAVVLSRERFFRERDDAADALLPHRDLAWWQSTIKILTDQGANDAPRLARQLIERLDARVSDDQLVATIFAELEVNSCRVPRGKARSVKIFRFYDHLLEIIPSARLASVLDRIVDYTELLRDSDWEAARDIAGIVASLILRTIREGVVGPADAPAVWRWLGVIELAHGFEREIKRELAQCLETSDALRRAIQSHALANDRRKSSLWLTELSLQARLVSLSASASDVVCAFERLAQGGTNGVSFREDWKELLSISWGPGGLEPAVRAAAEAVSGSDKSLAQFLRKRESPKMPRWKVRREKEAAKRKRKLKIAFELARRRFSAARDLLRAGELGPIVPCAEAYLGRFDELPSEMPPRERLAVWIGPTLRDDALVGFEAVLHRTDLPTAAEISSGFARGEIYGYSFPIIAGLFERMQTDKGVADLSEPLKLAALLLCHEDRGWNNDEAFKELCGVLEAELLATPEKRQSFARLWVEPALAVRKKHVGGLHKLAHDPEWQATGAALAADWLTDFPTVPETVEAGLVDCLINGGSLDPLHVLAESRATKVFRNFEHMLSWLAIDVLVRFEAVLPDLGGIGARNPEFLWFLRDRLQFEWRGRMLPLSIAQTEWIISQFRQQWPYAVMQGSGSGTKNDYDAADFILLLMNRIANDTSSEASEALQRLIDGPSDSYSNQLRHLAAEQRQKRVEEDFSPVFPIALAALLDDGPPANIEDLKALVLEEMSVVRRKFIGDDTDFVLSFWTDDNLPRDENRCRDLIAAMLGPELERYGVLQITEADMPMTKRADLAFARGTMQLPVEVKGQWHSDVWDAVTDQLHTQYLIEWRSEGRGVYCVLWFGDLPSASNRRLKAHPDGLRAPASAEEMRTMLMARIPEARRGLIEVVVFDLSRGIS